MAPPPTSAPAPTPATPKLATIEPVKIPRRSPAPRPEFHAFAKRVREAMLAHQMSASDLARAIWGTVKDYRGYDVARNRDRIGHYLAGISYPEPENLKKLADALGLAMEELQIDQDVKLSGNPGREPKGIGEAQLTILSNRPGVSFLQLKALLPTEDALKIIAIYNNARLKKEQDKTDETANPA
jgi:hypothetical protein